MVAAMWTAFVSILVIGGLCARRAVAEARGLDKLVALSPVFFAMPLAVFGAEHLSGDAGIAGLVPAYMPWRMFWVYFVGVALVAAALSIATRIQVQWSGLLFGVMMFLFVAMLHFPGALSEPGNRIGWVFVFREMSFGAGGWALAGGAMAAGRVRAKSTLVTVSRVLIGLAAVFFGVQHLLHPANMPGVPLEQSHARVDSRTWGRRLSHGRHPAGLRREHPDREEDANDGDLSRGVDRLPGGGHLWSDPDRVDTRSEHRGQGAGDQLFHRHPSVCRSDSRRWPAPRRNRTDRWMRQTSF